MKKKNTKKRIVLLVFIIIIMIILLVLIYRKKTSQQAMLKLLNENMINVNYSYTDNDNTKVSFKNNIEKVVYEDGSVSYMDYNKNEGIIIMSSEENTVHKIKLKDESNSYCFIYKDYFNNPKYKYKYEGKEVNNDYKCYVISFTTESDNEEEFVKHKFWINSELGILEQEETIQIKDGKEKRLYLKKFDFHNNKAKESDITKPDINGFSNIKFSL